MTSQYPADILNAQAAKQLDALAKDLQTALFRWPLEHPLLTTGIVFEADGTPFGLFVKAHHLSIRGAYTHVWLKVGDGPRQLGGRLTFWDCHDGIRGEAHYEICYEITFDALGNARMGKPGTDGQVFSLRPDSEPVLDVKKVLATALLAAFHARLEQVSS